MHNLGVVHLDVKDTNILLNSAGDIVLIDFGLACFISSVKPWGTPGV
jgi:serine/threonine protein kinase